MDKKFGSWTLTFLVIANMIGAGVFTTSGFSLADLGSPHLVVAAWVVGGVIAIAGAYSYGLLASAMPESGGEYLFLSRAAHPLLGFVAGWVSLIAGFSGAIALAATALEEYAAPAHMRPDWLPSGALATLSIVLAGALHALAPRVGAWAQNSVVILKLLLLAALLGFAGWLCFAGGQLAGEGWPATQNEATPLSGWALATAFAGSLVWISLSYSGFNAAVYIAGEVGDAERVVPRSLVTGTVIVAVLYVLLNAVFVYAAPPDLIAGKADVAAIAAESLGGAAFGLFARWTIVVCLVTSVFSMMMAAPRVYAKMADDGMLPRWLKFHGEAPRAATLLQVTLAVALVLVTSLQDLLSYLGLTLSISAACTAGCLFLPSVRTRPLWHPRHLPPLVYVTCTGVAATMMIRFNPWQLLAAGLTFAIGAAAYGVVHRMQRERIDSARGDR